MFVAFGPHTLLFDRSAQVALTKTHTLIRLFLLCEKTHCRASWGFSTTYYPFNNRKKGQCSNQCSLGASQMHYWLVQQYNQIPLVHWRYRIGIIEYIIIYILDNLFRITCVLKMPESTISEMSWLFNQISSEDHRFCFLPKNFWAAGCNLGRTLPSGKFTACTEVPIMPIQLNWFIVCPNTVRHCSEYSQSPISGWEGVPIV